MVSIPPSVHLSAGGQGLQTHGDCSFLLTEAGRDAGKENPQCFGSSWYLKVAKGGGIKCKAVFVFCLFVCLFVCLIIPLTVVERVMDLVKGY